MKETILGVIAFIFALIYNIVLCVVNMKCNDGEFVNTAALLIALNTIKDATILGIILYNIFLG